jgi:hypothetical protein
MAGTPGNYTSPTAWLSIVSPVLSTSGTYNPIYRFVIENGTALDTLIDFMKNKTIAFALSFIALSLGAFAQTPAPQVTPAPTTPSPVPLVVVPTPAPSPRIVSARATIPASVLAANLNTIPATPQSLLQSLTTLLPLPKGVAFSQLKDGAITFASNGNVTIIVRYALPQ